MRITLLDLGTTAESSDWQELGKDDVHNIVLRGAYGAGLVVEAKVGDGADDAQEIGALSASREAGRRIAGPLTYRVRRVATTIPTGAIAEDGE